MASILECPVGGLPAFPVTDFAPRNQSMAYFSRLSDIVTCHLSELLSGSNDPLATIRQIAGEIEQGVVGAKRSVNSAQLAEERIRNELQENRDQATQWMGRARAELEAGREDVARRSLMRKRELEDLLAGLEQQHVASLATLDQMRTTLHAIEARMSEVRRKEQDLQNQAAGQTSGSSTATGNAPLSAVEVSTPIDKARAAEIDAELEALRRELGKS